MLKNQAKNEENPCSTCKVDLFSADSAGSLWLKLQYFEFFLNGVALKEFAY